MFESGKKLKRWILLVLPSLLNGRSADTEPLGAAAMKLNEAGRKTCEMAMRGLRRCSLWGTILLYRYLVSTYLGTMYLLYIIILVAKTLSQSRVIHKVL